MNFRSHLALTRIILKKQANIRVGNQVDIYLNKLIALTVISRIFILNIL